MTRFIMVIDDDPALRNVLQSVLESAGYRVQAAAAPVATVGAQTAELRAPQSSR